MTPTTRDADTLTLRTEARASECEEIAKMLRAEADGMDGIEVNERGLCLDYADFLDDRAALIRRHQA